MQRETEAGGGPPDRQTRNVTTRTWAVYGVICVIGLALIGGVAFWWQHNEAEMPLEQGHRQLLEGRDVLVALNQLGYEVRGLGLALALADATAGADGLEPAARGITQSLLLIDQTLPLLKRNFPEIVPGIGDIQASLMAYRELVAGVSPGHVVTDAQKDRLKKARLSLAGWEPLLAGFHQSAEQVLQGFVEDHQQQENRVWSGFLLALAGVVAGFLLVLFMWQRRLNKNQLYPFYEQLFQGSYAIELLLDPQDGSILDANPAAVAFYGWDLQALRTMNIQDVNCLSKDEIAREMALARQEQRNHFHFRHRLANGEIRDVEVWSTPFTVEGRAILSSIIHDVTQHRVAERDLERSRQRYRDVVEASVQGFWFVAPRSGLVLDVNQALCELLGCPREDILGKSFISFVHPEDQSGVRERFSLADKTKHRVYDVRLKTAAGDIRHTRFHATSLWSEEHELTGSYAFVDDITERKKAREALQDSQQHLAIVIEAGQIGVWEYYPASNEMWFSPEWKAQLGYLDHEFPNTRQAWDGAVLPEDGALALQSLTSLADRGNQDKTIELSLRYRHRDGHLVYARCCARAVYDAQGAVERFIAAHLDLTSQFENQEMLARINAQTALILDSASNGVLGVDDSGRVTLVNGVGQQMLGMMAQDVIGRPVDQVLRLTDRMGRALAMRGNEGDAACPVSFVLRTGEALSAVEALLWDAQTTQLRAVELGVAPLRWQGQISGAVVSLYDVSSLQQQRQDLERSNNDLEQFAYVASHDLQEPLRTITSYLTLLRRRYSPLLDEDGQTFIATAVDGAYRMSTMIRDLLEYSRVGRKGVEMVPLDLTHITREAVDNLRIAIEDVGADVAIQSDMPLVMADRGQLVSLLQNLVGNAIKYRDPARPVQVWVRAITDGSQGCRVEVEDRGIGIEDSYFERIFQPFQRLHTREKYEGNGIGLAICRKIARLHGGDLTVSSEPGKGSIFTFTLALASAPSPQMPPPAKESEL
ncbi:PAS domain-containing sensor histidine kinase [Insolitispirillum peregrinum]|uniref:histidine kinase n=1 Tax=Insolitispirillum peregrinum TaxID=80876 RepID=A0A1N7IJT4_9PROT|nr:PAS domain S-box protein [Insolitispirillum peregrinum]SIS37328.1 PAS domain S-box-containing protein [Insolitispirillum peregrinum]